MVKRIIVIATLSCAILMPYGILIAQQIEASVTVDYEAVGAANKDLLQNFKNDIETYLNNYQWGQDDLGEKIKCNFQISIQSAAGDHYSAQIFIGSKRVLYNSGATSAVLRIFDQTWDFTYIRNRPINHNSYSFDDLASLLDFYVYVIIGYDYDTYKRLSGTPLLQRATDVASLSRASGQKGWVPAKSGYSRAQFADELNDNKFAPVRSASYIYHFAGLDSLSINQDRAWNNILRALDLIARAKALADPRNIMIRSFFDAKYMELAETFLTYPDQAVYNKLSNIDPSHQKTYEEYRAKWRGGQ